MITVTQTTRKLFEAKIDEQEPLSSVQHHLYGIPQRSRLVDIDACDGKFILVFEWEESE